MAKRKLRKLEKAVDEWQAAIDRVLTICDEITKEEDYGSAATAAVMRKRFLKLKKLKKGKRHGN